MWQYIKNFVIDHQSKVVKQIFKKASKNNFRWEMYYFFCSIKNLLPHIQNEYNKKYVQERNTLCTFCARTMFSLSRIDRIIFLCVFKMKKKIWFFEWHSTNIDDDDEVKEKNKKKKKKYPVFCTYTITTIQFYEDFIYSYKGHRPTENDEKSKWQTILLPFLRFFLSSERNKKKYKVVKLTNFFFVNLNSSKVLTYEFPMRSEENELYTKGTSLMELDVVDRKARTQRI